MAIGWLSVLQVVPWSEVISNAPKVAEGARKLWQAVTKKSDPLAGADANAVSARASETASIAALEARVITLEAAVSDLHAQMLASSELIKALAEQNTQLIQRIETNRVRLLWLTAFAVVLAMIILLKR